MKLNFVVLCAICLVASCKRTVVIAPGQPGSTVRCGGYHDTDTLNRLLKKNRLLTLERMCAVSNLDIPSDTTIACVPGAGFKKTGDRSTYLIDIAGSKNVRVTGCVIDGNDQVLNTQHKELIRLSNGSYYFDHLRIQNVGATGAQNLVDVFHPWNSTFYLTDSAATDAVSGSVVTGDPNKSIANQMKIMRNVFANMHKSAVWIGNNSASIEPADVEVAGNTISNCTDDSGRTGQQGNGLSLWQIEFGNVHDNIMRKNRFAGIRLAKTRHVQVHANLLDGNQECSLYCGELGASGNHCWGNRIMHFVTGISSVNQSQRGDWIDEPDLIDHNVLQEGSFMGIALQGSIATDNIVDNVPVGIRVGIGASYDHIVRNNTCLTSNLKGTSMVSCIEINTGIPKGDDIVEDNFSPAQTYVADGIIAGDFGKWDHVAQISQRSQAVVTVSSGALPSNGNIVCLMGVLGMLEANGKCAEVVSAGSGNFTLDLDTSGYASYVSQTGGQEPYAQVIYRSGTVPMYPFPNTMTLRNSELPLAFVNGLHDGSDFIVSNAACGTGGALITGSSQVRVVKRNGHFVCQ